ncbi:battenin [Zeugodacus cucurbitae]|uniref:battenin n=1 Tax=Zeugodacus cucurbitae TaxID=28588 RepID=UPI0023D9130D|nr:battenin [Zeugodacus cucurbitae]XP_011179313.2 battenin [Zeugodacus cucurbitae]XP_028894070.2 battenin [Zeugodacus cucurbitae]XP_028894077.2 battenin [Zeugodacus cucurbitae]XP_054085978.1 battenin [Zeugodacus cucurbitae]
MSSDQEVVVASPVTPHPPPKDRKLWRDLTAYWILGLCNNYGYVVMLSAAHDIIAQFQDHPADDGNVETEGENTRNCHLISTGAILLADIIPSLFVKIVIPFLPFWVNFKILLAVLLSASGFLLVGFANAEWMALLGVVITSASSGIGEPTFLSYSSHFNKNVVSTWSSGTGGAGVIGSLSYASLRALNVSPRDTMLIMLFFPALEAFSFWIILRKPTIIPLTNSSLESTEELVTDEKPLQGFKEKLIYIKTLFPYMLPLALVYFFEYLINQGLFELVYFENSSLSQASQYRWFNVDYQIGVFISRSSVNLYKINKIWLMAVFQFVNVAYFLTEVIYFYTPSIWITLIIVLWEGLLGGGAYVNTFYRMSKEITPGRRRFAMAMVTQSDAYGIALAGFLAIPLHNAICSLPPASRKLMW